MAARAAKPLTSPAERAAARWETITSRENRWLARFRAALRSGERAEDSWMGVEGVRLVEEALRSGLEVAALLVSPAGERSLERLAGLVAASKPARLLRTSERLFASVAETQHPQGVAALVRPRPFTFDDLLTGQPLVIALVGVQDPGNVGAVVRSAEAFGATGVIATPGTADPLGPKALRASAGSAFRLPVLRGMGAAAVTAQLRIAGLRIWAARPHTAGPQGTILPTEADLRAPGALLVGNEGAGLPAEVERSADARIRIPLSPPVESLNAAVAASVLLYEAARQRGLLR